MRQARCDEQGSILVLALLVSLILLGFGLTVMWVASSGVRTSANINRRQEALYAAEAGVERARIILGGFDDWNPLLLNGGTCLCTLDPGNTKGRPLCGPDNTCLTNIRVIENTSQTWSAEALTDPSLANYQYSIWIRNDWQDECDSKETDVTKVDCELGVPNVPAAMTDKNGRVIILVEGMARDGLSSVRLEVMMTRAANPYAVGGGYEGQKRMSGQGGSSMLGHTGS